jgi:hypothetical protein
MKFPIAPFLVVSIYSLACCMQYKRPYEPILRPLSRANESISLSEFAMDVDVTKF